MNFWRAWTHWNIQPLCQPCHQIKTRLDKRRMADLDAGRQELPELELA